MPPLDESDPAKFFAETNIRIKELLDRQTKLLNDNMLFIKEYTKLAYAEAEKKNLNSEAEREAHLKVWFTFLWVQLGVGGPLGS